MLGCQPDSSPIQRTTKMARPQLVSDEQVYSAAERVLIRKGGHAFSITAVAADLGVSRAAIILRFKSTEALKEEALKRMVQYFNDRMNAIGGEPGGNALLLVAKTIGAQIGRLEGNARFSTGSSMAATSPMVKELMRIRGEAVSKAVARAMPIVRIDKRDAISLFSIHLGGSELAWQAQSNIDPRAFLIERTCNWLKLVGIAYDEKYAKSLLPEKTGSKGPAAKTAKKKSAR